MWKCNGCFAQLLLLTRKKIAYGPWSCSRLMAGRIRRKWAGMISLNVKTVIFMEWSITAWVPSHLIWEMLVYSNGFNVWSVIFWFCSRIVMIPLGGKKSKFRITELFSLKMSPKIIKSNCSLSTAKAPTNHVPKCHIHTCVNPSRDGDSTATLGSPSIIYNSCNNA